MIDLNELKKIFDEESDDGSFDGDNHPIVRLAMERDALLGKCKTLLAEVTRLRDCLNGVMASKDVPIDIRKHIEITLDRASGKQVRDAACLDAGCDIDGEEPHRPHCDNAPVDSELTLNGCCGSENGTVFEFGEEFCADCGAPVITESTVESEHWS